MEAASAALNSLFEKTPAPGTRDGTSVADTEKGQKVLDKTEQAAQSASSDSTQSASSGSAQSASSDTAMSSSTGTTSGAVAPSVDKVTEKKDMTVDQEVAPAVEHDKINRQHETRERDVVEKEVHKDHYHTTVQPLKDREVQETEHDYKQSETEYRNIDKDDGKAKANVDQKLSGFQDTVEDGPAKETKAQDETVVGEHVHHHLHEIIQPVIEKEVVKPSVTHVTNPIKETVQEQSEDHGVTTEKAISVDEFKHKLEGESTKKVA